MAGRFVTKEEDPGPVLADVENFEDEERLQNQGADAAAPLEEQNV